VRSASTQFPVIENHTPHSWEIESAIVCCFDTPYDREYTFREIHKKNAYDLDSAEAGTARARQVTDALWCPLLLVRILGLSGVSAERFLVPSAFDDDRPPMVIAMHWVQQITSISIEMVAPAGLGYWLDGRWGTGPWLLAVGAVLGFLLAMLHLLALAKRGSSGSSRPTQGKTSE
jgi:hypothetical protein